MIKYVILGNIFCYIDDNGSWNWMNNRQRNCKRTGRTRDVPQALLTPPHTYPWSSLVVDDQFPLRLGLDIVEVHCPCSPILSQGAHPTIRVELPSVAGDVVHDSHTTTPSSITTRTSNHLQQTNE